MTLYTLTNEQARNFMLLKQGLIGDHKFREKQGVLDFIRQAGCVQFDPIDICGKNAELVLQSRVAGFTKEMLYQLLYVDRKLIDYFDKSLSIFCTEDWQYFSRIREQHRNQGRSRDKVDAVADIIKEIIKEKGYASSKDIQWKETVDWYWSPSTLSRAVLETLYFRGDLVIHHKKGTIKYYALASDAIDSSILDATDPNQSDMDFVKWLVLRRIRSVGLLWNKPSDAWLGISGLKSELRRHVFSELLNEREIIECTVDGVADKLYFTAEDEGMIQSVMREASSPHHRLEFIAPLDNMMWDRKLICALFDFSYKWEIYTPVNQRKYGYYVLPVLFGNRFAGRIELAVDKKAKQLQVRNFWQEHETELGQDFYEYLPHRLQQFADFNNCEMIVQERII